MNVKCPQFAIKAGSVEKGTPVSSTITIKGSNLPLPPRRPHCQRQLELHTQKWKSRYNITLLVVCIHCIHRYKNEYLAITLHIVS